MSSKSSFSNSTSNSYALALYELATESSELSKVERDVNELKELLNNSNDFNEMVSNPAIMKEEKKKAILEIANRLNFSQTIKKFLGFLSMKNRMFFLNQIIETFLNFASKSKGELKAKLFSSKKMSKEELEKIQADLTKDFKSTIKIEYKHDPDLIGGLIIQIGSLMIDTSVKSKLIKLEKNMIEA